MRFAALLSATSLLLVASAGAVRSESRSDVTKDQTPRSRRAPSTEPIDTASLRLGACLAIARCYYDGNQKGCLTTGCGDVSLLGQVCSCNAEVQAALTVQLRKGQDMWPVPKCSYS